MMENILLIKFTWSFFLLMALTFTGLYFALQFLRRLFDHFSFLGRYQHYFKNAVEYLLLIYEPLAIIILASIFTLINPVFHGLIIAFLLLIGFTHVRNYLSGRIIQANPNISTGARLRSQQTEGVIFSLKRLGLNLQTNEGLHHLSYSRLMADGYVLLSGEEIGGFYQFIINPKAEREKINHLVYLKDMLATTPYVDWNHHPELLETEETPEQITASLSLREERHLLEFMALVKEWGYTIKEKAEN